MVNLINKVSKVPIAAEIEREDYSKHENDRKEIMKILQTVNNKLNKIEIKDVNKKSIKLNFGNIYNNKINTRI